MQDVTGKMVNRWVLFRRVRK